MNLLPDKDIYYNTYIHTYTYIYTYIQTYIHTYIHTYKHTYTHIHAYIHIYTYIPIYIYVVLSYSNDGLTSIKFSKEKTLKRKNRRHQAINWQSCYGKDSRI